MEGLLTKQWLIFASRRECWGAKHSRERTSSNYVIRYPGLLCIQAFTSKAATKTKLDAPFVVRRVCFIVKIKKQIVLHFVSMVDPF